MRLSDLRASFCLPVAFAVIVTPGCNDSSEFHQTQPRPQIVTVAGPKDAALVCDPTVSGGACSVPISVTFRLPEDQFVWKAYVRFQGDGSDDGVDRGYLLNQTFGKGDGVDVGASLNANVPPTILRRGALFTYSVRLVTGAGEESAPATLNVSVQ